MKEDQYLELAALVFETSPNGVIVTDSTGCILLANDSFCELTGYEKPEIIGQNPRILSSGKHGPDFYREMWNSLRDHGRWEGEIWNRRKTGELYLESITITAIKNSGGEVAYYTAILSDITKQKRWIEKLSYYAYHDFLTDLPNRFLFIERAEQELIRSKRYQQSFTILFLDLDGFKQVNDTYGHEIGDLLIQRVAGRLKKMWRECDTVCRLSGDEFVVLLPNHGKTEDVQQAINRLHRIISEPYRINGINIKITASIGSSVYPADGTDLRTLMNHADQAMYGSKAADRDNRCL